MKSQHISILTGNSDGDSTAGSPGGLASYRARYQAFLNQQSQRGQRRTSGAASLLRFMQGLVSFAIFIALFLAILTLFGFGLSRLGVIAQVSSSKVSASDRQLEGTTMEKSMAPAAPRKNSRNK